MQRRDIQSTIAYYNDAVVVQVERNYGNNYNFSNGEVVVAVLLLVTPAVVRCRP